MSETTNTHLQTLRTRPEFLRTAKGVKWVTPGFVLQARRRVPPDTDGPKVGFTASRRVGGAVQRNFARRRLKHAVREIFTPNAHAGIDYVLVARKATGEHSFDLILQDLGHALHMVHKRLKGGPRTPKAPRAAGTQTTTPGVKQAPQLKQPGQ